MGCSPTGDLRGACGLADVRATALCGCLPQRLEPGCGLQSMLRGANGRPRPRSIPGLPAAWAAASCTQCSVARQRRTAHSAPAMRKCGEPDACAHARWGSGRACLIGTIPPGAIRTRGWEPLAAHRSSCTGSRRRGARAPCLLPRPAAHKCMPHTHHNGPQLWRRQQVPQGRHLGGGLPCQQNVRPRCVLCGLSRIELP